MSAAQTLAPSPSPTPTATDTAWRARTATPARRIFVIDEKNMFRIWLEEKVARHELTSIEADKMLQEQENQGKLWIGPGKDSLGSVQLLHKLAKDFASWKGAQVYFTKSSAGHDLVIFKGWPAGRKVITGTRYRVDNPKIVELQIGKPGIRAAARESARFGVYLVVAVDIADFIMRDNSTLGQLLGSLTVDIPSVLLASAIGAAAGTFVAGSSIAGLAVIGSLACGPFLVAFAVGAIAGYALYKLDEHFHVSEKLGEMYDRGLDKLAEVWRQLGAEAEARFQQLAHSHMVHDMRQDAHALARKLAREGDWVRGELTSIF